MPHLLVAGPQAQERVSTLNAMINSLLFKLTPDAVKFLYDRP
jgi:DNA segregation ATPase FtsK/SpoIIIE-like protein